MIPNTKPGDTWASWSGDGQEILFTDGVNLFKINPDGSDRTQLTFLAAPDGIPQGGQFSPDGKTAFVAGTIGGITGLFAIPTDGTGQATRVPAASGGGVTFVGSVNTTIHVVPLLKILSITASGAVVIASEPHTNYVLEATPSLNPAQWKPVRTNQATGGTLQLDDPDAAQNLSRFYRVFR